LTIHEDMRDAGPGTAPSGKDSALLALLTDERQAVSRELHDNIAHAIAAALRNMEIGDMCQERNPKWAQVKRHQAMAAAQLALDSSRDLASRLRDPLPSEVRRPPTDRPSPAGPRTRQDGVAPDTGGNMATSSLMREMFIIVREAVFNAVTHAAAERVTVEVSLSGNVVVASIEDNGKGLDIEKASAPVNSGLWSMRERAGLIHGDLEINSVPRRGTQIQVTVPLPRE
jgi:signal transduction histidine kinase